MQHVINVLLGLSKAALSLRLAGRFVDVARHVMFSAVMRFLALTFFFGMFVSQSARAQRDDLDALNQQIVQLYRQASIINHCLKPYCPTDLGDRSASRYRSVLCRTQDQPSIGQTS